MLKEYKLESTTGIWGGAAFFLIGCLLSSLSQRLYIYFGILLMIGGYFLFIGGCFMYAKGKGYNWLVGILGVLGPAGLAILYCLKDKSKFILKKEKRLTG